MQQRDRNRVASMLEEIAGLIAQGLFDRPLRRRDHGWYIVSLQRVLSPLP
jgi:hypothetical protein